MQALLVAAISFVMLVSAQLRAQCTYSSPGGSGCGFSSPFHIPIVSCNSAPTIGNSSFALTTSAPCVGTPQQGFLLIGTCLPAPIQFTNGPATGLCIAEAVCALHLDPCVVLPGVLVGNSFTYQIPIPPVPQFVGLQLCAQGVHTCSGLTCLMASNNARVTVQ